MLLFFTQYKAEVPDAIQFFGPAVLSLMRGLPVAVVVTYAETQKPPVPSADKRPRSMRRGDGNSHERPCAFSLGPVHTRRGVLRKWHHANNGTYCSQWEYSHSQQATSKGLSANLLWPTSCVNGTLVKQRCSVEKNHDNKACTSRLQTV